MWLTVRMGGGENDSAYVQREWQRNKTKDQLCQAEGFLREGNLDRVLKNVEVVPSLISLPQFQVPKGLEL